MSVDRKREGWICSYRSIWDHPFFKGHGMRVAVWHWLLHNAAWRETTHRSGVVELRVERGEVCFTQGQIQAATGATRKQVRDVIEWLIKGEKASKIRASDRAKGGAKGRAKLGAKPKSILRIEKYEEYQGEENGRAKPRATDGPRVGPYKEQEITNKTILPSEGADAPTDSLDLLKKFVWDEGKRLLSRHGVSNPGSVIGKWLRDSDPQAVMQAINAAHMAQTEDPVPYITQVLKPKPEADNLDAIFARIEGRANS